MEKNTCSLTEKTCKPCEGGTLPLNKIEIEKLLKEIPHWAIEEKKETPLKTISRVFNFKNYYQTIAFVNAMAWISHQENHHPDLEVGYNRCVVRYHTHAIQGLSENDFICAAKVDALSQH